MAQVHVRIDTQRFGFVKRHDDGSIDFVSPFPCPFAYGSLPGTIADDGDRQDAIVVGSSAKRGDTVDGTVVAVVRFVDAGRVDDKLVVASRGLGAVDRLVVHAFFSLYAPAKRILHAVRRDGSPTRYLGLESVPAR